MGARAPASDLLDPPCDYGNVKMGNTSYSKIAGIGDICLKQMLDAH